MLTTTIYKKSIHDLNNYDHDIVKNSTNIKIGKKVTKGQYLNYLFKANYKMGCH